MTVRRWDPETLYGPGEAPAGIPAGPHREPLYGRARFERFATPAGHREPLHVEPVADGPPRGVSPCTCPALEMPAHAYRRGCPVHDVAAAIRAELAAELAQEIERADHAALYGDGSGGPLVGILAHAPTEAPTSAQELAQDVRAALTAERHTQTGRELAQDIAAAARLELDNDPHALQLDARDRHAVAILADAGPLAITGRPVHALQLADGRAFLLQHTDGRPTWHPTGPRPLVGTEDAHEWHCPQCGATTRARMADHTPQNGPELAQWDQIRARQRERSTTAQHARQEQPQDAARELAATRRTPRPYRPHEDGPAPIEPMPLPVTDAARRPCRSTHCPRSGPCSPDSTCARPGHPVDDVEPCTHSRPATGPRAGRCPVDCPGSAGTRGHERPQELAQELAGPSAAPTGPTARSGAQDGPGTHPCPLADGAPCSLTPGGPGCCQPAAGLRIELAACRAELAELDQDGQQYPEDDPQERPQELADPSTPGEAPQAGTRHPGRPDCARGACPYPVPCVGPCHASILAGRHHHEHEHGPEDVDDAPQLDDVDDLADAARVEALADAVRDAGTWTVHRYAQRVEAAAVLHREPLHAFTDAAARTLDDVARAHTLPADLRPARTYWQTGPGAAPVAWPAPQERPGDREALHALQDVEQVDQTAHEHVRAVAQACTCTTRQREDPPCPVAADDAAARDYQRVRAHLQATMPGPALPGPFPPDASELHPAGPPPDQPQPLPGPSWSCSAQLHTSCRHVACPCPCPCPCHDDTPEA